MVTQKWWFLCWNAMKQICSTPSRAQKIIIKLKKWHCDDLRIIKNIKKYSSSVFWNDLSNGFFQKGFFKSRLGAFRHTICGDSNGALDMGVFLLQFLFFYQFFYTNNFTFFTSIFLNQTFYFFYTKNFAFLHKFL